MISQREPAGPGAPGASAGRPARPAAWRRASATAERVAAPSRIDAGAHVVDRGLAGPGDARRVVDQRLGARLVERVEPDRQVGRARRGCRAAASPAAGCTTSVPPCSDGVTRQVGAERADVDAGGRGQQHAEHDARPATPRRARAERRARGATAAPDAAVERGAPRRRTPSRTVRSLRHRSPSGRCPARHRSCRVMPRRRRERPAAGSGRRRARVRPGRRGWRWSTQSEPSGAATAARSRPYSPTSAAVRLAEHGAVGR